VPLHFTHCGFAGRVWNPEGRVPYMVVVVGMVPATVVPIIVVAGIVVYTVLVIGAAVV
jgi:hypothetical protein